MATRKAKQNRGLKGQELIDKILELTGSSNLLNYKGNIRDIAAFSGYLAELSVGTKSTKGLFVNFVREYHAALKASKLYQNDVHANFEALYQEIHKKYQPIPVQAKKSHNPKKLKGNELLDQVAIFKNETKYQILNKCGYLGRGRGGREIAKINRVSTADFLMSLIAAHANENKQKYGEVNVPKIPDKNYVRRKIASYGSKSYQQEFVPKCFKANVDKQLDGKYIDLCISIGHIHGNGNINHGKLSKSLRAFFKNEESFKSRVKLKDGLIRDIEIEKPQKPKEIKAETKESEDITGTVEPIRFQSDLVGVELLEKVLKLHKVGKSEISICILSGYDVDKIGTFRRAFAKAAKVKFAPLSRMLKEINEKQIISKQPLLQNKVLEINETEDLFIERERISSQIKRAYRNPRFREKILKHHGSICSCCEIAMETLLEAAHIIPVENNGNDNAENGIPLCPTHHTAFDNFMFTINPADNAIIYREGLSSQDLQITKTKCELKVSKESLEYRYKLFEENK